MRNAPFGPKPTFFQWKINIFEEKSILFPWAVLSWSLGGLGAVLGWSWADEGSMKDRWRDQWRVDEGSMKGSMKGRWRVDEGSMKGSMKSRWRIDEGINGVSRLVCQRQFEVEENSFCLATWLRLSESGWLNSSLDWSLQVWLQCSSPPSCSQHVLK